MFTNQRILLFFFLVWISLPMGAQDIMTPIKDFCRPGVLHKSPSKGMVLEYGYFLGHNLSTSGIKTPIKVNANDYLLAKFKIPLVNKEKFKLLLGARYFRETYHIDNPGDGGDWVINNLDGKVLKSTRFSAYLTRSFGFKHYLALKAEVAYNGDYSSFINFRSRYRETYLIGVFGLKKTEYKEWGLGIIARTGYRGVVTYPFFIYNHTFNEKWGLESTLPVKVMFRYRLQQKSLFLFGGEFSSRNYSIDMLKGQPGAHGRYEIRSPEAQLNIAYQQQLNKWVWAEIKTGYVHYMPSSIAGTENVSDVAFRLNKTKGTFLKFGFFLSPPSSYYK